MKLKLLSQQFTVFKSATVILMILLLSTTNAFSQCAYAYGAQVGSNYTLCIDNGNITTASVSTGQHVVINVVKGFNYTFSVGNVFTTTGSNYEKLTLFDGGTNATLTSASGLTGATISNWTSPFSGTVKLQLNRGSATSCAGTGNSALTLTLNSVGNTQDDPTASGTDQWIGHVYNWTGAVPPGGGSPTTLSTATNPFTAANYVGYYTIPTETIDEGFGGDYTCFPIFSNGVNRVNIYTETFAVRYRMRSTKTGSYLLNLTGDDGVRVYLDGKLVFDAWQEQSSFTYCNNLIYLSGNNEIVLDYYENAVNNVLKFSLTAFDPSTNAVTGPSVRNVCSNVSPGVLDGSSYDRCTVSTYANISFQWQVSTDNVNFSNIAGATAEDYTVPAVNTTTNTVSYYRRIVSQTVSNSSQPVLSSNVIRINTSANSLGTTGAISGTASLCAPASSQVYSIPAVNNALNYLWSVPAGWTITSGQGTRSITVIPGTSGQNGNISVIASNGCLTNAAQTLAVTVNPVPTSVTATTSATTICEGQTINLSATSISNSPMDVTLIDENFNTATNLWTTTNTSTGGTPANADWTLRGNNYNYSSTVFSSNDSSQFYLSNSDAQGPGPFFGPTPTTNTTLQSPSFSTVGLTSATLSFYHYYRFNSGASDRANVEVSTNGTTWTALTSYSSTQGARTNFALATVDLGDYLGQATVYIRFRYAATYDYYWAIDNVSVKGVSNNAPATYSWTSNPPGFTSTLQNPTGVAPTVNTTYTVTVTNAAGCSVTASTPEVVVNPNTAITTQPAVTTTYCQNAAATALTVAATGNGTLSYQWYSNTTNSTSGGTLIGGATSAGYTPSTTVIGTRYYYAIVTGSCGTAISNTAAVTVNQNTAVTTQPAVTTTYCQNAAAAALTVSATGSALTYQWYSNTTNSNSGGTLIGGATSASYTPSTTVTGTRYYYAIVTGSCGTATSNTAAVTVNQNTAVTTQPAVSTSYCQNAAAAALTVAATGNGTLSYQWYSNTTNSNSGGTLIGGATSAGYTPSTATVGTIYYYAVITGSCGTATSATATVTVNQNTAVTTQPAVTTTYCQNAEATALTVAATGNGTLSYQWYSNTTNSTSGGTLIGGATSAGYTPSTTVTGTRYYYAIVTGSCGTATSNTAAVIVNQNTAVTTQPAVSTSYCQNAAAAALTVSATGSALTYQWYSNATNSTTGGTAITGATSASYTPTTTVIGTRYYYAIVTGSCGTATSNTAAVIVNQNTAVTTQPAATTSYCQGAAASVLTVAATGTGTLSYQWYSNTTNSNSGGTLIGGATSASYTPSTTATGTTYYYVIVTGSCGNTTSNTATVTINSLPTATVVPSAIAPVCQNASATFNLTGTPGATVTYNINGGISQTVVLNGSGTASVSVPSVTVNQTLTVTSVFYGTCTNPATSSATVTVGQNTVYNGSGWTITPTATNNLSAEIRAAYSSSGTGLNLCSLWVTNNAPVVISTGDTFTIRNGIQVDAGSSLTVSSDANLIQVNDAAVNTGNITLKRDSKMKRLDYIYWGTPVEGQTLKTFSPNTVANRFYSYKEVDDTFSVITPLTSPMMKGNGYVIRAPNNFTTALQTWTATFTGKPHNGVVDVAVTKLGAGKNLVGNPYPSNINLDQLTIDNPATANGVYYFWTNINDWVVNNAPTPNGESGNYEDNNYALYNATGGVPAAGSSLKPSGIVKPGQGFLYEARAGGTLRFTNNVRTHEVTDRWGTGSVFISNKTAGAKTSPSAERYWLKLTNPAGQFNTLLMAYIEGATNSFEPRFDAKFPVESSDQFYSLSDGTNLIIQGRGYPFTSGDVVPLGMKGFEAGTYTMSLEDREGIFANGQNIYLKDKQTGIITNLSQGSYAFAGSAGVSNGRFEIIYEPQTVLAADGSVKETIQVYRDGSDFVIKSPGKKITAIEVYDTSGKLIAKSGANQTEVRMDGTNWVNGVYVLKINRNGEVITRKIVR